MPRMRLLDILFMFIVISVITFTKAVLQGRTLNIWGSYIHSKASTLTASKLKEEKIAESTHMSGWLSFLGT